MPVVGVGVNDGVSTQESAPTHLVHPLEGARERLGDIFLTKKSRTLQGHRDGQEPGPELGFP